MMATFDFQCQYMKLSLSLTVVLALSRQPSTGHPTPDVYPTNLRQYYIM